MPLGRLFLVAAVVLVVVVAGYATYAYVRSLPPPGATPLVVYTYSSLLGGCGGTVLSGLIDSFDAQFHANVLVECPPGSLVSTLLAQKNAPGADVVVGLDEITAPQATANGLLVPYTSPQLAHVDPTLTQEISPTHDVTPYESGYLAIDYNSSFLASSAGAVAHANFSEFTANSTWASNLMVEDPTLDITGEEFLLWEIAYETYLAHQDWTTWWQAVDPHLRVATDWGSAFNAFSSPPNNPMMVVSYAQDPAYSAYYNAPNALNATVSWFNGTAYGWKTIYGVGIVNGTHHLSLAQEFVDWFLSGPVQNAIPTNEWEYPANATVPVPGVYNYSIDPTSIVPLNPYIAPATVVSSLPGWLDEWQSLENQYG